MKIVKRRSFDAALFIGRVRVFDDLDNIEGSPRFSVLSASQRASEILAGLTGRERQNSLSYYCRSSE